MMYKHMFAIPAYGQSPWLETCIRSLKAQSRPSPIILCTSAPSIFLENLAAKYEIPLFVRQGESNIRDDWNYAYEMAEGEYVTIAHQDDVYHKEYTTELLKAAEKWPDMTVFTTDYVIAKGGSIITGDRLLQVKRLLRLPLRCPAFNGFAWVKRLPLMFGNAICCPATTYHKSLLGEPLVRSEYSYALDWDNLVQLAERPGRFICREKPLMYYRVHDGAATKACMKDNRREKEEREMFARFWPEPVVRFLMRGYSSAYKEYE